MKKIIFFLIQIISASLIWIAYFEVFNCFRIYNKYTDIIIALGIAFVFLIAGLIIWLLFPNDTRKRIITNPIKYEYFIAMLIPFAAIYCLTDKLFTASKDVKKDEH